MEAAPKLAMLSLDLKESRNNPNFRTVFRQFISANYGESGAAYDRELVELEGLRNSAVKATRDISGCNVLKRYFCQLKMLYPRFPMKETEDAAVEYSWQDNFTAKTVDSKDPKFEEANILYNIGALHSILGAIDRRGDSDAMKVSCTHFQCAAWAFEHLRDKYPRMPTFDLSFDVLSFYITLMLAQAQECILEKSLLDNRKSSIIARVAAQVVEYYKECLKTLDSETTTRMPGMDNFKDFIPRQLLELKVQYYQCIMNFQLGCQAEESQKWGERIAYLDAAAKELTGCSKLIKNCGDDDNCREAVKFVGDIVQQKSAAAKKDNDFIYHERIPDVLTLPPTKGASLVKGIPLNETDFASQDIFSRLVPISAHEKASLYSEKKASLLREITEKVENKDVELMSIVSALRLEQLLIPASFTAIPQSLLDTMASLRGEGDVSRNISRQAETLNDATEDVRRLNEDIGRLLEELKKSALDDAQRSQMAQLDSEFSRYSGALAAAVSSSDDLQHYMDSSSAVLHLLSGPVETMKNSLPAIDMEKMTNEKDDLKELERLRGKVDEMKRQRQEFLQELRASLQNDDITGKVLAVADENLDSFFEKELGKHSSITTLLEQNISAQENIIAATTAVVERLADLRAKLVTTSMRREEELKKYESAYRSYQVFSEKVAEGLEFYRSFKDMLSKLKTKVELLLKQAAPIVPKITRPPAPVLPPTATPSASSVQGPTLRDYLNRKNSQSNEPIHSAVPTHHDVSMPFSPLSAPFMPPPPSANSALSMPKPTLRDYLEAKKMSPLVANYHNQNNMGMYAPVPSYYGAAMTEPPQMPHYQPQMHQPYPPQPMNYLERQPSAAPAAQPLRPPSVRMPPPPATNQPALYSATRDGHMPYPTMSTTPNPPAQTGSPGAMTMPSQSNLNQFHPQHSVNPNSAYQGGATSMSGHGPVRPSFHHDNNQFSNQPYSPTPYQPVSQPAASQQFSAAGASYGISQAPANFDMSSFPQQTQQWNSPHTSSVSSAIAHSNGQFAQTAGHQHSQPQSQLAAQQQPAYHSAPATYSAGSPTTYPQFQSMPTSSHGFSGNIQPQPPVSEYSSQNGVLAPTVANTFPDVTVNTKGPAVGHPNTQNLGNWGNTPSQTEYAQNHGHPTQQPEQNKPSTTLQVIQQNGNKSIPPQPSSPHPPVAIPKKTVSPLDDIDTPLPEASVLTPRRAPFKSQVSADDLLTVFASPAIKEDVRILQPEVLTVDDIKRLKEQQDHVAPKDPLTDPVVLERVASELREFQKNAEEAVSSPDTLERIWKQLRDIQDRDSRKHPIGVARCYPTKNRDVRVMPYDSTRVVLQGTGDDYINASLIDGVSDHCPKVIATQTPMSNTVQDFWMMVLEQGVEVIAAIMTEFEVKEYSYWPSQRQTASNVGPITVVLQKEPTETANFTLRMLAVTNQVTKVTRNIVHLLFKSWPADGVPQASLELVSFLKEVRGYHKSQRIPGKPLIVHCNLGVGPTGIFCAAMVFYSSLVCGSAAVDITETICKLRNRRKFLVDHKEQLKFLYSVCITLSRQVLHRYGLLPDYIETTAVPPRTASPAKSRPPQSVTPLPDVLNDIRQELQRTSTTPPLLSEKVVVAVELEADEKVVEKIDKTGILDQLPPRLTDLNLQLDTMVSDRKKRITKENFVNPSGGLTGKKNEDASDPFADFDPLWSMKK
ncbi:tyrosine-protein phosphatase non-receptor type 23-like [Paramacrobiotus metropolitanus]|uniref:tyrosine-protein phosphatase non-receptor type 23-like n=1 Tax=Paramacrobiotus metropolitanus TaxID=2943436 RepID=UPI00244614F3|nr:tyrosine-protein phosphatase non-receptor type 23-like [Paramacrobiotus metropolitanus]XP_055336138.1 tyrosine-protein phosphatase non-receptor type 23-like [Paramacrobiotus metropolitanus]XP_055336139.1 tyrosine-protein phosphatase non-receptor type 23-like [Paramacrobiotus metropolitanus]